MNGTDERARILVVDDEPANIRLLAGALQESYEVLAAASGAAALERAALTPRPDLILLDIMMPDMDGLAVCRQLKANAATAAIPVIFVTARSTTEDETVGLATGAVDFIVKPLSLPIVRARIRTQLQLKRYRDQLEEEVAAKTEALRKTLAELQQVHSQVREGYIEAIYRLTLASEYKDEETGEHIRRVSYYTREVAAAMGMDNEFLDAIFHASPMHDLGKVGIPDNILLKPGKLTAEEWEVLQRHTIIGGKILEGSSSPYLNLAREIALYHHERWQGGGYPFGLAGEAIPLAARIMNLADQYDALRSKRPYKPELPHEEVVAILTQGDGRTMPDHFDPTVLHAFTRCTDKFDEIFQSFD